MALAEFEERLQMIDDGTVISAQEACSRPKAAAAQTRS
jgi:hypothetical protein